jgi:glutaredoxin
MDRELRDGIAALLTETGEAHHEAFASTNGEDPDWPIWYADYLRDRLADRFGMAFTRSKLIYCLMRADFEHRTRAADSDWTRFYADEMVQCYAPSDNPAEDRLALYYYDGCAFCALVRSEIQDLGLDVELRNIFDDAAYRDELVAARGRTTVPVLRITSADGEERWMPESRDIVAYLQETYGER